jgi:ABC-type phosphate transport system permease subunit
VEILAGIGSIIVGLGVAVVLLANLVPHLGILVSQSVGGLVLAGRLGGMAVMLSCITNQDIRASCYDLSEFGKFLLQIF